MNLNTVATKLASAIQAATGLRCYSYAPPSPEIPSLWIQPPELVYYDAAFGRNTDEVTFTVSSAVRSWNEQKGQEELRDLVTSIKTAFDTDKTIDGSCSRARLVSAELTSTTIAGNQFLGFDFTVSVLG